MIVNANERGCGLLAGIINISAAIIKISKWNRGL
jgi:hypothetical protein